MTPYASHSHLRLLFALYAGAAMLSCDVSASLHAQEPSLSCGLLQVGELEAAIGGKAKDKPSGARSAAPGMTIDNCSVVLVGSAVTYPTDVRIVSGLGMDGARALTVRNTAAAREEQWKVPGAKLEQATVGKAVCILSGRPNVVGHTICSIPRGDGYVEVDVRGPVTSLPSIATVAALVQKASSRL